MGKHSTDYDGCGIYALLNDKTHYIYIGKSSNIKKRFDAHRTNFNLVNSVNKMYEYPLDDFSFFVLHKCSKSDYERFSIVLEEAYMIYFLKAGFQLYNRSPRNPKSNIINDLLYSFGVTQNVKDAFQKEYGLSKVHYYLMRGTGFNYLKASPEN